MKASKEFVKRHRGGRNSTTPSRKSAAVQDRKRFRTARTRPLLRWASLSPIEVVATAKAGLRGRELWQIQQQARFSNEEWSRYLQVTPRTIQRYRTEETIDSASSERAILMAQIVEQGREVFGTDEKFKIWFHSPSFSLGGIAPNEILDTTTGMHLVKSELTRIEYGVF